jgi:sulfate permease, SulP family
MKRVLKGAAAAQERMRRKHVTIILAGIHTQPYMLLEKTGTAGILGRENVFDSVPGVLERAAAVASAVKPV